MELEKFDIEKAKAGRKVVEAQEPHRHVVKWDVFGKGMVYLLDGMDLAIVCDLEKAGVYLALAPEERYVILFECLDDGRIIVSGSFWVNEKDAIAYGESITDSDSLKYLGTYKLVKV